MAESEQRMIRVIAGLFLICVAVIACEKTASPRVPGHATQSVKTTKVITDAETAKPTTSAKQPPKPLLSAEEITDGWIHGDGPCAEQSAANAERS